VYVIKPVKMKGLYFDQQISLQVVVTGMKINTLLSEMQAPSHHHQFQLPPPIMSMTT